MLAFRSAIEHRDPEALAAALAPDVVFSSPAVFAPYRGRDAVMTVLRAVLDVFEDLQYTDELTGDGTHGLVFRARVGTREIEGWDYLTTDDAGLVSRLVVMIRPLSGLNAVGGAMARRLASG